MELWIRSQDRERLVEVNKIEIFENTDEDDEEYGICMLYEYTDSETQYLLGTYKDKKRALEILDEIQNLLKPKYMIRIDENLNDIEKYLNIDDAYIQCKNNGDIKNINNNLFYEMPKE